MTAIPGGTITATLLGDGLDAASLRAGELSFVAGSLDRRALAR